MKKRPKSRRSSVAQIDCFSMLDELLASPTDPAPEVHAQRIAAARAAVASMRSPETASITAWSLCCMVGNILETMLQHGLVADPDGLLQDGFDALKRAARDQDRPDRAEPRRRGIGRRRQRQGESILDHKIRPSPTLMSPR